MSLESILRSLPDRWAGFITRTPQRYQTLKMLSLGLLAAFIICTLIFTILHGWSVWIVLWTLWSASFAISIWLINTPTGKSSFYPMVVLLIVLNYILWVIPLMILVYLFYKFLEKRRISRLEKISHSTPDELAAIKDKPKIIIQVRKD